jgi:hypothetical protein
LKWLRREEVDVRQWLAATNAQRRVLSVLSVLGIARVPKVVSSDDQELEAIWHRAQERAAVNADGAQAESEAD